VETSAKYREYLVENVVEEDEEILGKYLEGEEISEQELVSVIRKATLAMHVFPVLCGSALRNKGVQPLFDAVVNYLPSPLDVPPPEGKDPESGKPELRESRKKSPFSALAFKVMSDPDKPTLTYIRIYSGSVHVGDKIYNSTQDAHEKISRIYKMHSNSRQRVDEAMAGEIVAIVGFKVTRTGDTVCDFANKIMYDLMMFPEPVISVAIEPKSVVQQTKLRDALETLTVEDPTFHHHADKETGQTIISGMGELHLEILVDRLLREFRVEAKVGKPQVSYRETVSIRVESEEESFRQIGDKRLHAKVKLVVEPNEKKQGLSFVSMAPDPGLPDTILKLIEESIQDSLAGGIVLGYPIIDIKVSVLSCDYEDDTSTEADIKSAAAKAFYSGCKNAGPVLMEPIMKMEIITPKEFVGEVINNLNLKRGIVGEISHRKAVQVIHAEVPLKETFGYATDLRSLTQGRGTYTMQVSHYQKIPETSSNSE
jgi:elongation factor G